MIEDFRQHLQARPFEPFAMVTTSGHRFRASSAEHAGLDRRGNRVLVWFEDGGGVTLSGLHIAAVAKDGKRTLRSSRGK
jgi:hypothetical protein